MSDIFDDLFKVLAQRKTHSADSSYVASLYVQGLKGINAKIEEEAKEVMEAAQQGDKEHLLYEVCDVLFHLFVLCEYKEVSLEDIRGELTRRFGISGLEEKREREKSKEKAKNIKR